MSFLRDLKKDWSQAVNELLPEEELLRGQPGGKAEGIERLKAEKAAEKLSAEIMRQEETEEEKELQEIEQMIRQEEAEKARQEEERLAEEKRLQEEERLREEERLAEEERLQKEEQLAEEKRLLEEEQLQKEQLAGKEELPGEPAQEIWQEEESGKKPEEDMEMAEKEEIYEGGNVEKELFDELVEKEHKNEETEEEALEVAVEAVDGNTTIITKGTVINGSISSDGSLEVMGTITGDIDCLGRLSIVGNVSGSSTASEIYVNTSRLEGNLTSRSSVEIGVGTIVVGDVTGTSAVISGAVKGEVDVNGPVVIDSTAIVKGNINARSVQINNGAVLDGYCALSYSDVDLDTFFNGDN